MSLQVRFTFSDELMKKNGMKREDVYYTLKKNFVERGLVCVSDDDVLMFEGTGHKDDFGYMWGIIMSLIEGDWFIKCASSCDFIEDGEVEDVFSQIPEVRRIMATA